MPSSQLANESRVPAVEVSAALRWSGIGEFKLVSLCGERSPVPVSSACGAAVVLESGLMRVTALSSLKDRFRQVGIKCAWLRSKRAPQ